MPETLFKGGYFDVRILVYDPYVADDEIRALRAQPAALGKLLAECDYVSLHVPLTDGTRHMIGARELARMKPTAALVNTSRGALVDTSALARVLKDGGKHRQCSM